MCIRQFQDLDGSLTGDPNPPVYIYKKDAYFIPSSVNCYEKEMWNLKVCRKHFNRVKKISFMSLFVEMLEFSYIIDVSTHRST